MTPLSTAGVETELKFELDSEAMQKLREHPAFAEPQPSRRLRSVYFDTPDHDLRNRGLTLRVRETSGDFVQTVKQRQNGLFGRDEWEQQVKAEHPDPLAFHDTPVEPLLGRTPRDSPPSSRPRSSAACICGARARTWSRSVSTRARSPWANSASRSASWNWS